MIKVKIYWRILSDKLYTKETNYSQKPFVVLLYRIIDRLIGWLNCWLIDWFIHSFIQWYIHSFIHYGWSPQTYSALEKLLHFFYSQMASVCWWYFFSKIIELLDTVRNMISTWLSCLNHPFSEFSGKWKYTFCMFNSLSTFVYSVNACPSSVEAWLKIFYI